MGGENSVNESIMSYGYTYFMVLKSTMCCWILTSNPLEWQRGQRIIAAVWRTGVYQVKLWHHQPLVVK